MIKSINKQYKTILYSNRSRDEKDKAYTNLMKYMEAHYNIPMIRKADFETEHREIIAMYRKLSLSRDLS